MKRSGGLFSILMLLALIALSMPALAQSGSGGSGGSGGGSTSGGGGSGGSGGSGGGGGGGEDIGPTGGSQSSTATMVLPLTNNGIPLNGAVPQGTATFTFAGTTPVGVTVQFSHVNLPDDTDIEVLFNRFQLISGWMTETLDIYHVPLLHGQGSLTINTSNSLVVPFLAPRVGETDIAVRYLPPGVPYYYLLQGTLGGV